MIWGARINPEFAGKVRLMAIITGVKSAQVLGPAEFRRGIIQERIPETIKERIPEREKHIDRKRAMIDVIK